MVQKANHIFGVLLDRNWTLRDIRRTSIPLKVDRNDRMVLSQFRKRFQGGKSKGRGDENERIAGSLDLVVHLQTVVRGVSAGFRCFAAVVHCFFASSG